MTGDTTTETLPTPVEEGMDTAFIFAVIAVLIALFVPPLRTDALVLIPVGAFLLASIIRAVVNRR